MTIVSVSLSHRITPVELLEKLVVPSAQLDDALVRLHAVPAIDEVVLLSTCNRLEVYAATNGPVEDVARAVAELMAARGPVPVELYLRTAVIHVDARAVEHLYSVACGLDSMAIGEDQIVAQIKAAMRSAVDAATAGPRLHRLMEAALRTSKRARTETRISKTGISLARVGIDLAQVRLGRLDTCRAVVLGTGGAGKLAARLLADAGVGQQSVAGRNEAAAARLAAAVGGTPLRIDDVPAALATTDLLITATGSHVPVVLAEQVRSAREGAADRPLFVLDLGMPSDVEAAVGELPDVTLVDIAGLGRQLAEQHVPDETPRVRAIVAEEVALHLREQHGAAAAPVIGAMHTRIEELVEAELRRLRGRPAGLNEEQRLETSATVHRILRAFLHGPSVRARQLSTEPEGWVYVEALRQLFDPGPGGALLGTAGRATAG